MNVLKTAEIEKKNKYGPACEEKHMSFTPLVTSIDGVLAPEFTFLLKRLADGLASKWDRPYSHVMCWVRCRISFAILRATNICIRGNANVGCSLGVPFTMPNKRLNRSQKRFRKSRLVHLISTLPQILIHALV